MGHKQKKPPLEVPAKREVNELLAKEGQPIRYPSAEEKGEKA